MGLGKPGIAASRLLKTDGWDVTLSDSQPTDTLQHQAAALIAAGIKVHLGETVSGAEGGWATTDAPQRLGISPGVSWDLPTLNQARA